MDLSDYLQLIRRGWAFIVGGALVGALLGAAYLAITPKEYDATASVVLVGQDPRSLSDAAQAAQLADSSADTVAGVIDSTIVLGPVAAQLSPSVSTGGLGGAITVTRRGETAIVDIGATSDDAARAASEANAVAAEAIAVVPALQSSSASTTPLQLRLIQRATPPVSPTAPNVRGVLLIALVLGAVVGLGVAVGREALDKRLRRPEDVRSATTAPVLALIPRQRRASRSSIAVRDEPAGAAGEAFRSLRTAVRTLESDGGRSLLITSAIDDRIGVMTAVNLAWSLAQAGRSTVLIDADLRGSQVGEFLGVTGERGLSDMLAREATLDQVLHKTSNERLYVIPTGRGKGSPSDLLSSRIFVEAVKALEREFEFVLVSAPPVMSYTDAAIVAGSTAHTVIVVSSAHTTAAQLASAIEVLANVRAAVDGVVLADAAGAGRANRRLRGFRGRFRLEAPTAASEPAAELQQQP